MSRPRRRRLYGLACFALIASALALPLFRGAGAQVLISDPTVLPGDTGPLPAAAPQVEQQISRGSDSYLAVWSDSRTVLGFSEAGSRNPSAHTGTGQGSQRDIYAARVSASGQVVDATSIVVDQGGFDQTDPRVGWNGQNWLVVYTSQREDNYFYYEVRAKRVSPAGVVLDEQPIIIDADAYFRDTLTYSVIEDGAGNWVVVYSDSLPPEMGAIPRTVNVKRVAPDGTLLDPDGRLIYKHTTASGQPSQYLDAPKLERAGDRYLLTFIDMGPPYRLMGLPFDSNFVKLRNGPELLVGDASGYDLASDGNAWLATYSSGASGNVVSVYAVRISRDGDPLGVTTVAPNVGTSTPQTSVAWDGTLWFVAYSSGFDPVAQSYTADDEVYVTRLSPAAAPLDPQGVRVTNLPGSQVYTDLAAGVGGGAQVTWSDMIRFDVGTARVSRQGAAEPPAQPALAAPRQAEVRVAPGGGGFLAVFRSETSGVSRILGQHLDAAGAPVEPEPFVIGEGPRDSNPSVGWNGSQFLAVWDRVTDTGVKTFGRLVPAAGAPGAAPFLIMNGDSPDAAGLTTNGQFLVVNIIQKTTQIRRTQYVRVDGSGAVVGTPVEIEGTFNFFPRVAQYGSRWLAVWEFHSNHDDAPGTIHASFVDANGAAGPVFTAGNAGNDLTPHLAVAGETGPALVVWGMGDIRARRINADGTSPDPQAGTIVSDAPATQARPAVTWDGNQFVVTWIDHRNQAFPLQPRGDVYAARVAVTGVRLAEFPVADSPLPEETPFVSSLDGLTLFAYAKFYPEAPYASHRVTLRTARLPVPETGAIPAAPSGLVAHQINNGPGTGTASLTWADNSNNETGFKVEMDSSSGSGFSQVSTTGADSTGASGFFAGANVQNYFRVRAYNAAGDSAYSNVASPPVARMANHAFSTVHPSPVEVAVTASDPDGLARADFYAWADPTGGQPPAPPALIGTDLTEPFSLSWTPPQPGHYHVTARVYDAQGSSTTTYEATVWVRAYPTAQITSPPDNSIFVEPANITFTASAQLNSNRTDERVLRLDFYAGDRWIGEGVAAVFGGPWSFTWRNAPVGTHAVTAQATNNFGDTGISAPVRITVNPLTPPPPDTNLKPSVSLTSPADGATFAGDASVTISATASDPTPGGSIARVEFRANGFKVAEDASAPYSADVSLPGGAHTITAVAFDNEGGSTVSAARRVNVERSAGVQITSTRGDGQTSSLGPSSRTRTGPPVDSEAADDFDLAADIDRVVFNSTQPPTPGPADPNILGAWVRFYAWQNGYPGALQEEVFFAAGDPGMAYSGGVFDFKLPRSFRATGKHFVSAQILYQGGGVRWYWSSANTGLPQGAPVRVRNNYGAGAWTEQNDIGTTSNSDAVIQFFGTQRTPSTITSVSPATVERSNYFTVDGNGFGAQQGAGRLRVDGLDAPVVKWSATQIVAYVPEAARLGSRAVTVVTTAGTSNEYLVTVTERQRFDGRVRWRAKVHGDYLLHRVAVAPAGSPEAGSVYGTTVSGLTFAWSPSGALKWIVDMGDGVVSVGPDGTVYLSEVEQVSGQPRTGASVVALAPDGTEKWRFVSNNSMNVMAGPSVGPDGKVYAVFEPGGQYQIVALNPDGTLAWARVQNIRRVTASKKDIAFGRALPRLYFGFPLTSSWPNDQALFAYDLDGDLDFTSRDGCCGTPAVPPDDDLRVFRSNVSSADGRLLYVFPEYRAGLNGSVSAGEDNTHYLSQSNRLSAVRPDGTERWHYDFGGADACCPQLYTPVVNRQNTTVFAAGQVGLGSSGVFVAVNPADGSQQWLMTVPNEPGFEPYGHISAAGNRPVFSPDGETVYVAGDVLGDGDSRYQNNRYFYLYALDTTTTEDIPVNQPPRVRMMSPLDGANFPRNSQVELAATAEDDQPVAAVSFYYQRSWQEPEQLIATDTAEPYTASFQLGREGGMFIARVRDAGSLAAESRVSVAVPNDPPRVTWLSPADGTRVEAGSNLTLVVRATDPDGSVTGVNFFANGLIGTDTTPDAEGRFEVTWSGVPAGTHQVHAQAIDDNGIEGRRIITVTATAPPSPSPTPGPSATPTPTPGPPVGQPPTVRITSPANDSTFPPGTAVTLTAEAQDPDGTIARVDFYQAVFEQYISSDLNAPYTAQVNPGTPDVRQYFAVAVDNAGNRVRSETVRIIWEDPNGSLSISGVIRHQQSDPGDEIFLPDALVELHLHGTLLRTTRTDSEGRYLFGGLSRAGEYGVRPAEPGYTFYPPMVTWSGLTENETYDFVAEGPLPPGPRPTPTPGSNVIEWQRFYNSPYSLADVAPLVAVDAQGNTHVAATSGADGGSGDTDISTVKYAPDGTQLWARTFAGLGNYKDWASDIAVDGSGNVYVTGTTWRGNAYSYDLVTIKYDAAGAEQWVRHHNGPLGASDMSNALALDPSGNVLVTGYDATRDPLTGKGFDQFVTIKYAPDGSVLWTARRTEEQQGDHAIDVACDSAGNVYVVGFAWTGASGSQSKDIVTVKYSPAGQQLWSARQNGRPGTPGPAPLPNNPIADEPGGVGLDPSGNVYVFGSNVPGDAQDDYLLLRYDPATGALVWGRNWTGPAYDYARDMAIDQAGNVYLTGSSYDIVFQTVNDYPSSDVATVKFDPAGNVVWARVYRAFPGMNDFGRRVVLDSSGNAYVGAFSAGFVNGDTAVVKYLPDGTEAWVYRYDNPQHTDDNLSDMAADAAGNVYLAGSATITQTSGARTADLVTVKLAAAGAALNSPPEVTILPGGPTIAGAPGAVGGEGGGPAGPTIAGRSVRLTAQALDRDGTVVSVRFYLAVENPNNGATELRLLGTDTTPPYEYLWENVEPGTYAVTAMATDNSGATRTAQTETVTVVPGPSPTPTPTPTPMPTPTPTPGPQPTPTPTPSPASDAMWFDDALPAGAAGAGNGESWSWVGASPSPYSGSSAHQSAAAAGFHNHYFMSATHTMTVQAGDRLYSYVYLDPSNLPEQVMLQWYDGSRWYNAFWGADRIDWIGARTRMGDLPAAGQWVRLEVPAAQLGLEGRTLSGMAFNLWGGRVTWDCVGRSAAAAPPTPQQGQEVVWFEDALPAGATPGANHETWDWAAADPAPYSGALAHRSASVQGLHNHYFMGASETLQVGAGDKLFVYVYVDPSSPPQELMLQWYDGSKWYNAYWGADQINWVGERVRVGDLPAAGGWVRLEVPAAALGLEGKTVSGMAFDLWDGRAAWDRAGKLTASTTPPPPATNDVVWVEDALPAGAQHGSNAEAWAWVGANPMPFSGKLAHQSSNAPGFHNHYFMSATETLTVGTGEVLFAYVYVDPSDLPQELMLQWYDGSKWYNAYWGEDRIDWIGARTRVGDLPAAGQWVRLEVPASALGLEGKTLSGMAFNMWRGRATWDKAGKGPRAP